MKKIILISLLALISVWVAAQSHGLYYEGQLLDSDAEKTISAQADSGLMLFDILDGETLISEVYPNPATNYASADYDISGLTNAKIVIFSLLGSKVKEIELTDTVGTLTINTSDFLEGIYFYSLLINNEALNTQKLIIKH